MPQKKKSDPAEGIDVEDAPPAASPMDQAPFDPETHRVEQRQNVARAHWHAMCNQDAQVRYLDVGIASVNDPQRGQGLARASRAQQRAALPLAEKEAARLRKVASHLVTSNDLDEVDLLAERISFLEGYVDQLTREQVSIADMVDHPGLYGHANANLQRLDLAQMRTSLTIIDTALADARAELAYYDSQVE